jgi:hypothetical protein
MDKKVIKLFMFCLQNKQNHVQKCQRNKHSSVKRICNVIKKIITLQYRLVPQTCIQPMKGALEEFTDTEYLCSKTNTYQHQHFKTR